MILGLFKSRMILAELSSEYGISKSTFNNVSNTVKIKYRHLNKPKSPWKDHGDFLC